MNAPGSHNVTQATGENRDLQAIKDLLGVFRERLQSIDGDLCSLGRALDGPPGAIAQLEDEIHDRDTLPIYCSSTCPANAAVNSIAAPDSTAQSF